MYRGPDFSCGFSLYGASVSSLPFVPPAPSPTQQALQSLADRFPPTPDKLPNMPQFATIESARRDFPAMADHFDAMQTLFRYDPDRMNREGEKIFKERHPEAGYIPEHYQAVYKGFVNRGGVEDKLGRAWLEEAGNKRGNYLADIRDIRDNTQIEDLQARLTAGQGVVLRDYFALSHTPDRFVHVDLPGWDPYARNGVYEGPVIRVETDPTSEASGFRLVGKIIASRAAGGSEQLHIERENQVYKGK